MNKDVQIHIGKVITARLDAIERSQRWLSKRLCIEPSTLCKKLKKSYIETDLLMRISHHLDYDFFAELSKSYRQQKTT
jgi:hypothetical protein